MCKTEIEFYIDLIGDMYKTSDPFKIQKHIKSMFDITVSIRKINSYLNYEEDLEKESKTIKMKQIF